MRNPPRQKPLKYSLAAPFDWFSSNVYAPYRKRAQPRRLICGEEICKIRARTGSHETGAMALPAISPI